jgi:molybdate transport system substrate-binding protein
MLRLMVPLLAGFIVAGVPVRQTDAPITVSAAASLTDALEAIASAFAESGGGAVRFNFAGSNVLARQLASGAPVDLFISADAAQMDVAQRAGAIDAGTRIDLLGNRLAVVARAGMTYQEEAALLLPGVRRIAIGDPAAVPSGVYARLYFERAGLWDRLEPKLVPVSNVRAALAAVENGSADAAVVYVTDAALSRGVSLSFVLDGPAAPRIVFPAAVTRGSRQRAAAERFLAFLRGSRATAIFKRLGFIPLAVTR